MREGMREDVLEGVAPIAAHLADLRERHDWPADLRTLWEACQYLSLAYTLLDELSIDAHVRRAPESEVAALDSVVDFVGAAWHDVEALAAPRLTAARAAEEASTCR